MVYYHGLHLCYQVLVCMLYIGTKKLIVTVMYVFFYNTFVVHAFYYLLRVHVDSVPPFFTLTLKFASVYSIFNVHLFNYTHGFVLTT